MFPQIVDWGTSSQKSPRPCAIPTFLKLGNGILIDIYPGVYVAKSTRSTFDLNLTHSPVRSNKGPIPTPSNHASRPSFDTLADMINDTLEESPQSHAEAKKHVGLVLFSLSRNSRSSHPGQALIRDGYRCVVTKSYDIASVMKIRELKQTVDSDPSAQGDSTHCAHILLNRALTRYIPILTFSHFV